MNILLKTNNMSLNNPNDGAGNQDISTVPVWTLDKLGIPAGAPSATQRPLQWEEWLLDEITGRLGVSVDDLIVWNTLEVQTHTSLFTCVIENEGLRVKGGELDSALFSDFWRSCLVTSEKSDKKTRTEFVLSVRKI